MKKQWYEQFVLFLKLAEYFTLKFLSYPVDLAGKTLRYQKWRPQGAAMEGEKQPGFREDTPKKGHFCQARWGRYTK